jgi:hypothetical protein
VLRPGQADAADPPAQLFLHPREPGQISAQLDLLPQFEEVGCQHAVLSFYQPPDIGVLQRCAAVIG